MSEDLVQWLRVQLDADERVARQLIASPGGFYLEAETEQTDLMAAAAHVFRWSPARVLREVEAKRRIVDGHLQIVDSTWPEPGHCLYCWDSAAEDYRPWPCDTLRLLALPYSDRPGYREEWRPTGRSGDRDRRV